MKLAPLSKNGQYMLAMKAIPRAITKKIKNVDILLDLRRLRKISVYTKYFLNFTEFGIFLTYYNIIYCEIFVNQSFKGCLQSFRFAPHGRGINWIDEYQKQAKKNRQKESLRRFFTDLIIVAQH
jgi:hypothetical protein